MSQLKLPLPDQDAQQNSVYLIKELDNIINQQSGSISFSEYMNHVLYMPNLGYYSNPYQKFGRDGDYITAPEVSDFFSDTIAHFCRQRLAEFSGSILEFGAGSGRMAATILKNLAEDFTGKYYILELSAYLKFLQQQTLKDYLHKVVWLDGLPENFTGVVLANEVLDALPVHLFTIKKKEIYEKCVGWQEDKFTWVFQPANPSLKAHIKQLEEKLGYSFPEGYTSEINLWLQPWFRSLATSIQSASILIIDYGFEKTSEYYHPSNTSGTLRCYYKHQLHENPFVYPGLQDITTYVDFEQVIAIAKEEKFELEQFQTQANFLLQYGIETYFTQKFEAADDHLKMQYANQMKMLLLPTEMGERFKVMELKTI